MRGTQFKSFAIFSFEWKKSIGLFKICTLLLNTEGTQFLFESE